MFHKFGIDFGTKNTPKCSRGGSQRRLGGVGDALGRWVLKKHEKKRAFDSILTPAGAKKPPGKFNTATFWRPRAAKMRKKHVLEGVLKKQEMLMGIRSENRRFLMARKHVWRYSLRLFHTFAIFE